jgi:hypothetical protein
VDLSGTATSAHQLQQQIMASLHRNHMHLESIVQVAQVIIDTASM